MLSQVKTFLSLVLDVIKDFPKAFDAFLAKLAENLSLQIGRLDVTIYPSGEYHVLFTPSGLDKIKYEWRGASLEESIEKAGGNLKQHLEEAYGYHGLFGPGINNTVRYSNVSYLPAHDSPLWVYVFGVEPTRIMYYPGGYPGDFDPDGTDQSDSTASCGCREYCTTTPCAIPGCITGDCCESCCKCWRHCSCEGQ